MCPVTLTAIGGVVTAATTFIGMRSQAAAAEANAAAAREQAQDALEQGQRDRAQKQRQIAAVAARQRVATAANNVTQSGSALALIEDTAYLGAEDLIEIDEGAERRADGFARQAGQYQSQASANRVGSILQPAGTLLSTAGRVSSRWDPWRQDSALRPA